MKKNKIKNINDAIFGRMFNVRLIDTTNDERRSYREKQKEKAKKWLGITPNFTLRERHQIGVKRNRNKKAYLRAIDWQLKRKK